MRGEAQLNVIRVRLIAVSRRLLHPLNSVMSAKLTYPQHYPPIGLATDALPLLHHNQFNAVRLATGPPVKRFADTTGDQLLNYAKRLCVCSDPNCDQNAGHGLAPKVLMSSPPQLPRTTLPPVKHHHHHRGTTKRSPQPLRPPSLSAFLGDHLYLNLDELLRHFGSPGEPLHVVRPERNVVEAIKWVCYAIKQLVAKSRAIVSFSSLAPEVQQQLLKGNITCMLLLKSATIVDPTGTRWLIKCARVS